MFHFFRTFQSKPSLNFGFASLPLRTVSLNFFRYIGENWSAMIFMIFEAITLDSSMANGKCLVNLKESGLELPALVAKELQMSTALESCSVR